MDVLSEVTMWHETNGRQETSRFVWRVRREYLDDKETLTEALFLVAREQGIDPTKQLCKPRVRVANVPLAETLQTVKLGRELV